MNNKQLFVLGFIEIATGLMRVVSFGRVDAHWDLAYSASCISGNYGARK